MPSPRKNKQKPVLGREGFSQDGMDEIMLDDLDSSASNSLRPPIQASQGVEEVHNDSKRPFSIFSVLSNSKSEEEKFLSDDRAPSPLLAGGAFPQTQFLDQDDISIIRLGLEEALGADGQGSWLPQDKKREVSLQDEEEDKPRVEDTENRLPLDPDITASDYNAHLSGNRSFLSVASQNNADQLKSSSRSSADQVGRRSRSHSRNRSNSHNNRLSIQNAITALSSRVVDENEDDLSDREPEDLTSLPRRNDLGSNLNIPGLNVPTYPDSVYLVSDEESILVSSIDEPFDPPHPLRHNSTAYEHNINADPNSRIILFGKSLRIFPPNAPLRQRLYRLLHKSWVPPFILAIIFLHFALLCYDTYSIVFPEQYVSDQLWPPDTLFSPWGHHWLDWCYLIIFIIYTAEIVAKIIVFNFWDDGALFGKDRFVWSNIFKRFHVWKSLALTNSPVLKPQAADSPVFVTFSSLVSKDHKSGHVHERAFLRSSWNRVDFISVVAYWISLFLSIGNLQNKSGFFVFKAISCLRIFRFLAITRESSLILRSLKEANPYIADVSIFIGFFWILFAFIGVQSFSSSFRRTCVWVDPSGREANYSTGSFCGSYYDPNTLQKLPYVYTDGSPGPVAKGLTCPVNSICVSDENPYSNTVSFDNIFNSLELTFVVMSVNTFTDLMYDTIRTDYPAASLFFIFGALILGFWLANLLIAVVATEFRHVRRKYSSHRDNFFLNSWFKSERSKKFMLRRKWGRAFFAIRWIWLIVIGIDLILSCTVGARASQGHILFVYKWNIWTSSILAFEVLIRFVCYLPFWREFFRSKGNVVDSLLGIINVIIILPFVYQHETLFAWLTVFQVMRFYRIAIAVPSVKDLWVKVLGNYYTIWTLTIFLFGNTLFSGIVVTQLLRGLVPMNDELSFFDLGSSFLGMYSITTTENWTDLLYLVVEYSRNSFEGVLYATFFIIWFIYSNYIIMNLFIGLINENLEVSEDRKRIEQIKGFIVNHALSSEKSYFGNGLNFLKNLIQTKPAEGATDVPQSSKAVFDLLLERRIVQEFISYDESGVNQKGQEVDYGGFENVKLLRKVVAKGKKLFYDTQNPFRRKTGASMLKGGSSDLAQDFLNVRSELLDLQKEYLKSHRNYNVALYIFKPYTPIRSFCQKIVASSFGERIEGYTPRPIVWYSFSSIMLLATFGMVVTTCINTPLYNLQNQGLGSGWIEWSDGVFLALFCLEFIMKIIADGLFYTPNGFLRSPWNVIDLLVLISFWITFVSEVYFSSYISHYIRAMQALRALRLLSVSRRAQTTFYNVVLSGFWKIVGAGLISLTLLFPFSIWGLNIFRGKLSQCNDSDLTYFTSCHDEYLASPYNWDLWAPRAMTKTYYDFDTFPHAFRIQFEVISLEGWVDVLQSVMAITGKDTNPENGSNLFNAFYPVLYNIVGAIFILTLFISVIIQNYSESRGTAFLTDKQQSWYEFEKLLSMIRPERQPVKTEIGTLRYRLQRFILQQSLRISIIEWFFLLSDAALLLSEFYPSTFGAIIAVTIWYLIFSGCYLILLIVRCYAIGWKTFSQNYWNIYAVVSLTTSFTMSLIGTANLQGYSSSLFFNFQKLCMVCVLALFIPKSRRLNLLFSAATNSMVEIGNLLITWFVLFLAYAIALNQVFGLTKFGFQVTDPVINFRTVPNALILLFRMSCGEGWNQILDDFLLSPPYCVQSDEFENTDCGDHAAAYILFMSWNLLSMYIFVNLFISLVYENFSYILHKSAVEITDDDVENFKQAWSKFDPKATGYIAKPDLYKLLRITKGYFSMRIYEDEFSVSEILSNTMARGVHPYDVNIKAINEAIRDIPVAEVKRRRVMFDRFCEQAMIQAHPRKGISFQKLIAQFPMYKNMDPNKCLTLEDYLKHKLLTQKISVELLKKKITGFLQMARLKREFENRTKSSSPEKRFSATNPFYNDIPSISVSQSVDADSTRRPTIRKSHGHVLDLTEEEIVWDDDRGRTSAVDSSINRESTSLSPRRGRKLL